MAEDTAVQESVADQPQSSPSEGSSEVKYGSFLGIEPSLDTPTAGETPDTSAEEEPGEGTDTESEEVAAEGEEPVEEGAEEQSIDDWLQDLTQRETSAYSKRYPTAWKMLNDPNQPEDVKHLLRDKINSDRELATRNVETESDDEPTVEAEVAPAAQQTDPAKQQEQYKAFISDLVKKNVNPESSTALGKTVTDAIASGLGLDFSRMNDANLPQEAKDELRAIQASLGKAAPIIGEALAAGATDLFNTIAPALLPQMLEQLFPGSTANYQRGVFTSAWDNARSNIEGGADLPDFGTDEFGEVAAAAATKLAGSPELLESMTIRDPKTGRELSPQKQFEAKYRMLAMQMVKPAADPKKIAEAVQNGKQQAKRSQQKLAAGRALGAGQSTKTFGSPNDVDPNDPLSDLDREIGIQNASMTPFGKRK